MKKNKLIGIVAITAMMGLSGCDLLGEKTCVHKWSAWEVMQDATCREKGQRSRYCLLCDKEQVRSMPIDTMYGHKYVENEEADVAATCTTNGVTGSQKCLLCGQKKKGSTTPLTGHIWQKGTPTAEETQYKDATCTEPGLYKNVCKVCSTSEDVVIEPKGHTKGSLDNSTGLIHKLTCDRPGCGEVLGYELLIREATGFSSPTTKMNAKSGASSMSTWNISSLIGNVIEPGFYDIELEAAMTDGSHSNRKLYNMANTNLQVEDDASVNGNNSDSDKTTESDYRYFVKVDASSNYNPTTKKSFGELGLASGTQNFNFIEFVNGVQIDADTQTISLCHGNIGYSLYCNSLKLKKHDHELRRSTIPASNGGVGYTLEECTTCGYIRLTIDATTGAIGGGKQNAGPAGYVQLPANNDYITYKFGLTENLVGKIYAVGKQDPSKSSESPYGNWKLGNEDIQGADVTKTGAELLDANGEGQILLGDVTLKNTSFGDNEIKFTRSDENNLMISKIVFEGRNAGHLHNYVRKASGDKAATCKANKEEWYECSCGQGYHEEVPDSKTEHTYVDTWVFEPDCEYTGTLAHKCSVCGSRYTEEVPRQHNLGAAETPVDMDYSVKKCTICNHGAEATWALAQSMIEVSTDGGNTWTASTDSPFTGKMSDGTTDVSVFKFDKNKLRRVTLTYQNDGDATDGIFRLFATTKTSNIEKCQPYRQTIEESQAKMKFKVTVNDSEVTFDSKVLDYTMKDLGLKAVNSSLDDSGTIADPMYLDYCKVDIKSGLNTIVFETPEGSGYSLYIGGFQLYC